VGAVTALGDTLQDTWRGVVKGKTAIGAVSRFPVEAYPSKIVRPLCKSALIWLC
jgi:3-oxoacyl-(acyl-carrier-protein) synthase